MNLNKWSALEFGSMGETLIAEFVKKRRGWHDILEKGDCVSPVDFVFVDDNGKVTELAEVKTYKSAFSWGYQRPYAYYVSVKSLCCNYFPLMEALPGVPFKIYVVDATAGIFGVADLAELEKPVLIDGVGKENLIYPDNRRCSWQFPFDETANYGNGTSRPNRYYSVQQFEIIFRFAGTELQKMLLDAASKTRFGGVTSTNPLLITWDDVIKLVREMEARAC